MSKKSVAETLDISRQTLYDILNEKHPVTAEMAVRFGKLFGNSSQFWINLQRNNGLAHAERSVDISRIPTLGTRHAWTTAARDCASLRTPKSQCVTMLWRRFMRNHHLTAKALADSGFIVIAPTHTPDHLVGSSNKTFKALNWRMQELSHALEAVLQLSGFRNNIDLSWVHGLGYSLGSATVMAAAGAGIDGPSADKHCADNEDPNFCDTLSFIQRWKLKWVRDVNVPDLVRDIPEIHFPLAFINGNIAVIAPIGQGLIIQENIFRANLVYVVGFEDDTITVPEFHFERLARIIPGNRLYGAVMRAGNHSAFIAPFANRVKDNEDIPAARDPLGFDRVKFISDLNEELIEFFHSR